MTATLTKEIKLTDIGPVKGTISIPIPEPGGICVLRGRNGIGKTKTLEAVESALTGRGKPEVRDGALQGEVDAFGVKLTVGRRVGRSGELIVESLDGKLSISDLIDPGIKSPEAADAKRIKALVMLANVLPSAELFYELAGGRESFEAVVGTAALASDDLVTMAERIKRDFEAAARKAEQQAEHAEGRARGAREAASGTDATAECDPAALQSELEAGIRLESDLKARAAAHQKAALAARQAQDQLEDAENTYSGPTLTQAQTLEADAKHAEEAAQKALRDAEEALKLAKQVYDGARTALSGAISNRKTAEQHENMVGQWREAIKASIPEAPAAEALTAAAQRVTAARQAVEQGALIRKAKQHLIEAAKHADEGTAHRKRSMQLREAAHGVDGVLSKIVAQFNDLLRVEHGRLTLDTKRGNTYYHDLSVGERSKIAAGIGIRSLPKIPDRPGVLTLSQEIFEGLDPINRGDIDDEARECHVVILTAEASEDEEINATVFAEN